MTKKSKSKKRSRAKLKASNRLPAKKKGPKLKPAKIFIYALAIAALGGGGYLVYDRIRRRRVDGGSPEADGNSDTIIINNSRPSSGGSTSSSNVLSVSRNDAFPLKRGSRGNRVVILQSALAKINSSIKVDGQFGPQTAQMLKDAGFPETVDESLFSKITSGNVHLLFNPVALSASLYKSSQSRDLKAVISTLQQIKSVSEYSSVNEYYKKQSFISKTIVTDLLEYVFKRDELAREQIKKQFLRIGLKVDDKGTWSLQGIPLHKDIITLRETLVIDSKSNRIPVRKNTILGEEIKTTNGMTWFRSIDGNTLKVTAQDIKYS